MRSGSAEKNRKLNYTGLCICAALTFAWMLMIFFMSSRNADDSTVMSHRVGRLICSLFIPDFEHWDGALQEQYAALIDHPVRKLAHMTEYAVLGMLWYADLMFRERLHAAADCGRDIGRVRRKFKARFLIPVLLCALYACTDEIHQLLVPGRSGQLKDVCIDTVGACAGIGICLLAGKLKKRIRERKMLKEK